MPKACIGAVVSGTLETEGSAGLPGIFGASAPAVTVVNVKHKNPDGTSITKDTR